MPTMPAAIGYGTVTGQFLLAIPDTADADHTPDATAAVGTITFTPGVSRINTTTAIVLLEPFVYTLDANGNLKDSSGLDPQLVAVPNGDSWTWTATFAFTNTPALAPVSFTLAAGQTVDLRTLVPVDPSTGNPTYTLINSGGAGTVTSVNTVAPVSGDVTLTAANVGAVPTSRTVAGHALSANVSLVKGDVGLGNVDNTSDVNKPVSTATQTALNLKANTSSLAEVATTGDYGSLINAPAIPASLGFNITNDMTGTNQPATPNVGDWWVYPSDPSVTPTLNVTQLTLANPATSALSTVLTNSITVAVNSPRVLVMVTTASGTNSITVTDTDAHTWHLDTVSNDATNGQSAYIFSTSGVNWPSSGKSVTVTSSVSTHIDVAIVYLTGATTITLDKTAPLVTPVATGTAYSVQSYSPTTNAEVLSVATAIYGTGMVSSFVPGAGYTGLTGVANATTNARQLVAQYKSADGAATTAPCSAANSHPWIEVSASYLGS